MPVVPEARNARRGQEATNLSTVLDAAEALLRSGDAEAAVDQLCNGLRTLRAEAVPEVWQAWRSPPAVHIPSGGF